jgi:hypothetical protein
MAVLPQVCDCRMVVSHDIAGHYWRRMRLRVEFPMRTVSLNRRPAHWGVASRKAKRERREAYYEMRVAFKGQQMTMQEIMGPIRIKLTRVAPSSGLDSHDNLRGSFKNVVDGVCDFLGIDDGDPRLVFEYAQGRGDRWRVIIEVESPMVTQ